MTVEFEQPPLRFDAPADDPITAYLACALTGPTKDQLKVVELISSLVSDLCAECGVLVHQPVLHTSPKDHPDLSPMEVHLADFGKVIASDAVILLGDYPSWGGGKELAWAERMRIPVLVLLHEDEKISRLVEGGTGDIQVGRWRFVGDVRGVWRDFFERRKQRLETHRRLRTSRGYLWGPVLSRLNNAYASLSVDGRREVAATALLTDYRVREILGSPLAVAEASVDELQALAGALGLAASSLLPGGPSVQFTTQNLLALESAAEVRGWTGTETVALQRRAMVELAKGGARRLSLNSPEDWMGLADS